MRSGRKRWSGRANVSLDLLECRPNESGASGCRRLSGLAGAPQVGAAAERWAADWSPAIPRSASHCRRQRPIHTQKTDLFFGFFFPRRVGDHMAPHCSHVRVRGSGFWKGLSSVCLAVVLSTPAGVHEHEPCSSQSSHLRRTPVVQRMNPHHTVSRRPMSPRRADRLKPGPLRIPRWHESTIPDSQTARARRMPPGYR